MRRLVFTLAIVCLVLSMWIGLTAGRIAPVQRNILYLHVPNSICALLCFGVLLIASISYLISDRQVWDWIAAASAEAGLVFATILNATGTIFSRAEWNVWWTPSPRLITSAILWFLYVVYLILRLNVPGTQRRRARIAAVFAIIGFLDVPLVYVSARFMPDVHRPSFSFETTWQSAALALGMAGTVLLASALIWLRTEQFQNKTAIQAQELD
jgi:heme exporter protein C